MTSADPMTREELLESAALDALGLLDEYESALFTRSFHQAPNSVQKEIRNLQAEVSADDLLLPDEAPPPELRQRVVDAVADAVERESERLAPLASIGLSRAERLEYEDRLTFRGYAPMWRAAAFVLAGAVIVMAYFASIFYQHSNRIAEAALGLQTREQLEELIGPDYADFINNPSCVRQVFRPVVDDYPGQATVYVNPRTDQVFFLGMGLPATEQTEPYTLAVRLVDGTTRHLRTFNSNGLITAFRLDKVSAAVLATSTWQVTTSSGAVLLQTT